MKKQLFYSVLIGFGLALCACRPIEQDRGYADKYSDAKQIVVGKTTREEVDALLGSPSSTSSFGDEVWYYVSQRTSNMAFFDTKIEDQKVLSVSFDQAGVVKGVNAKGLDDARAIKISKEATTTEGNKLGVVEQLLGNLGRFNTEESGRQ